MIVVAPATSKVRTSCSACDSAIRLGRQRGRGDPDRDVHPEHPFPADVFGQHAAEEDAGGAAGAGDRAPDPQRFVALGAVAEGGGDDRERGGGEDRRAEALDGAGGDQLPGGARQAAGQRGEGEEHQAEHEDAAAAEQVGQPAAEQEEAAEGEDVGVDHPGQAALAEVERLVIVGRATLTIEASSTTTNWAEAEQDQRDPALVAGVGGVGHPAISIQRRGFHIPFTGSSRNVLTSRSEDRSMCRNIRTLHNFDPPASDEDIQASALQYVRKISGSTKPSQANAEAFDEAVEAVADVTRQLLEHLVHRPRRRRTARSRPPRPRPAPKRAFAV